MFSRLFKLIYRSKMNRKLAVFDFDHTIIENNSDTSIVDLIGENKIPSEVKQLYKSDGWTAYMQGIFKILYQNQKTESLITEHIKKLKPVPGMLELIRELNENMNYDVIIISDSNSYFIQVWLEHNGLYNNVKRVFTNPAQFENGLLVIRMYHFQDTCKLSTKNLCKGQILEEFIASQKQNGIDYEWVVYCGDGMNDFCPILRLDSSDLACVRSGYKCQTQVEKARRGEHFNEDGTQNILKAQVLFWKNAYEILDHLKSK